jgi:hypothetical protein
MTGISSSAPCAGIPLVPTRPEYLNRDPWHRVLTLHTHRILSRLPLILHHRLIDSENLQPVGRISVPSSGINEPQQQNKAIKQALPPLAEPHVDNGCADLLSITNVSDGARSATHELPLLNGGYGLRIQPVDANKKCVRQPHNAQTLSSA